MTTLHVAPQKRFLRVVRMLALVSTIGTPVVVSFVGVGCSDNGSGSTGTMALDDVAPIDAGISASPDTRPDTRETDTYPMGTSPPPVDSGHDTDDAEVYDGAVVGVAPLDTGTDAADTDGEVGIGGPLRAPEMPDEVLT